MRFVLMTNSLLFFFGVSVVDNGIQADGTTQAICYVHFVLHKSRG